MPNNNRLTLEEYIIQNKEKMIVHFDSSTLNTLYSEQEKK